MLADYGKLHLSSFDCTELRPDSLDTAVQGWSAPLWRKAKAQPCGAGQRARVVRCQPVPGGRDAGPDRYGDP